MVFELKLGRFDPPDLGQLQFYVRAVDGQVRDTAVDAATIGVLLQRSSAVGLPVDG